MQGTITQIDTRDSAASHGDGPVLGKRLLVFYALVVVVQSVHVVEHIIQLVQVYVFGVPDDDALGLLGYIYQFQGTEEWLHLVFNLVFLTSLVLIAVRLLRSRVARSAVPIWAMAGFLFFGVWLEGWHVVEHVVIISNVVANDGCPCPGIVDAQLGVSDTILHFGYNTVAYAATTLPLWFVLRSGRESLPARPILSGGTS
jgi:hypothetical protein